MRLQSVIIVVTYTPRSSEISIRRVVAAARCSGNSSEGDCCVGTPYTLSHDDLSTLDTALQNEGVNPTATDVNKFLISRGDTTGINDTKDLISVFTGTPPFPTNEPAQVDNITVAGTYNINTDQYPLLQAIILDDTGTQNLTVTGHNSILIATGNGTNTITLQDHGNDIVEAGSGSNTITGGSGADSIYSGGTNDSVVGSSGAHSYILEHGANATVVGGSGMGDSITGDGANDSLVAGGHGDYLTAGSGAGETLDGGSFHGVTEQGGSGAGQFLIAHGEGDVLFTGSATDEYVEGGGRNDSIYAGGGGGSGHGGGTLVGGGNNDHFIIGNHGSDTITGSGSGDNVLFEHQHFSSASISTAHDGVTTVSFSDTGQQFRITGVQTLTFADGHVVHL